MEHQNKKDNIMSAQGPYNRAKEANKLAKQARAARDKRERLVTLLGAWEKIMMDSPVKLLTIAFFILAIVEIVISWRMYGELQSSILSIPNPFLSLFIGMMVVTMGAVVSHYVAKRLSSSLFALEVFNLRHDNPTMSQAGAEEAIRIKTKKHFTIGMILFALLMFAVLAISFQRVALMGAISGVSFGLFSRLMPAIVVMLEVFCGIYLGYFFRRRQSNGEISRLSKEYEKKMGESAYETDMCHDAYVNSTKNGEELGYNRELRDALYRFEHRSLDRDGYVDEIPEPKNVKVLVLQHGKVLPGAHLFGLLPGNSYTNAIWTNDAGQAILEWQSSEDYLQAVVLNNSEYKGPFHNNTQVKIDIDNSHLLGAVA